MYASVSIIHAYNCQCHQNVAMQFDSGREGERERVKKHALQIHLSVLTHTITQTITMSVSQWVCAHHTVQVTSHDYSMCIHANGVDATDVWCMIWWVGVGDDYNTKPLI